MYRIVKLRVNIVGTKVYVQTVHSAITFVYNYTHNVDPQLHSVQFAVSKYRPRGSFAVSVLGLSVSELHTLRRVFNTTLGNPMPV